MYEESYEGENMKKDYKRLNEQREILVDEIKTAFKTTYENAVAIYEYLENENILQLEPGDIYESGVERLFEKNSQTQNELKMQSIKLGNITFRLKFDTVKTLGAIASIVNSSYGLMEKNNFMIGIGLFGIFVYANDILGYEIAENGTAIILALQNQCDYQSYKLSRVQCWENANVILREHHYSEMNEYVFADELTKLIHLNCIEVRNDIVILKEKVSSQF